MMGDSGVHALNVLGACVQRETTLEQFARADEILIEKEVFGYCGDFQSRFTEVCLPLHEGKAPVSVFACGAE
jgi:hypothetical protein